MHQPRAGVPATPPLAPAFAMTFREFVPFVAALMAINALGIDSMLPALPAIGRALHIATENERQWIVATYVFGFGGAQLFYGPLADRFGRRRVLIAALSLYAVNSLVCAAAWSFASIIAARLLQGIAAAASRVLAISIVRDRYEGRQMARVMSLAFIVFLAVPILAPSIGQLILLVAPWRGIFLFLGAFGAAVATWATFRLPETLDPADRRPIEPRAIGSAMRMVIGDRVSIGYTTASMLLYGALLGFINSSQQIFGDTFGLPDRFPLIFAAIAATMGFAAYTNSRLVERFGTRLLSHAALLAFIAVAGLHLAVALAGLETVWTFALFQAAQMGCFSLAGSNFGSMAMEPVGHIAGTASATQGFLSTVGGALIGILIGQSYDGTTAPVCAGYVAVSVIALGAVLFAERGRLFKAHHAPPKTA